MPTIDVNLNGDGVWPDLADIGVTRLGGDTPWLVAVLTSGMSSGRPSIALRLDLPDGNAVVAETSVRAFIAAADILRARFPYV